ncbi:acyl-CoA dehydrogenase family protein, partial [Aquamicrobium defluvii]
LALQRPNPVLWASTPGDYATLSKVHHIPDGTDGAAIIRQTASCKLFCSEMVGRVADRAVQIHGGAGYMEDYPVEHFYRDVRLFRLYEGTSQIQQIIIAREMTRELSG